MTWLEVAVAAPIPQTLTYGPPADKKIVLQPGMRLLVPLSGRLLTGYLLAVESGPLPQNLQKIRPIIDVLDDIPLFPPALIPFYRWLARYYHYPIGEVIKTALPAGIAPRIGRRLALTASGLAELSAMAGDGGLDPQPWLAELLAGGELAPDVGRRLWRTAERKTVMKWQKAGWLTVTQEAAPAAIGPKTETCVRLLENQPDGGGKLRISERKTMDLVREMTVTLGGDLVPRRELAREYSSVAKGLKGLEEKGMVRLEERRVFRDPLGEAPPYFPVVEKLTDEQESVLLEIEGSLKRRAFSTFLLHGVTGSGKTEVYLRAAATALADSRSVLVLVPEIALATQLEAHFVSRFGDRVALLHSGLSAGERFDQWSRLLVSGPMVVIGARSAVFAPLTDIGLVVVDEEHDGAFKQEDGLRYQGRDLAVLRASQEKATVILGSATPSVLSSYHAASGKYRLLTMAKRIENRPLPEVEIVDLRSIRTVSGRPPLFSPQLVQALKATLAKGEQSLVFLNRRGYANCMVCQDCGETVQCRHCQVTLTMHLGRGELVCHYCGHTVNRATICAKCQSGKLVGVGFGTERLEIELKAILPTARIGRLDRDTCVKRRDYLSILKTMRNREIDILLGTQMITKGHHFPNVTLVGVVWADVGLGLPDFRAAERTFQLISQVTGRAGRGEAPGRVIVQTHQPDHYSIRLATGHDFREFYDTEMALRQKMGFPPFSRLINLRISGENEDEVRALATVLGRKGNQLARVGKRLRVLGPAPAPLERLRGRYRWQLLLQGGEVEELHDFCRRLVGQAEGQMKPGTRVDIDVDPENML